MKLLGVNKDLLKFHAYLGKYNGRIVDIKEKESIPRYTECTVEGLKMYKELKRRPI